MTIDPDATNLAGVSADCDGPAPIATGERASGRAQWDADIEPLLRLADAAGEANPVSAYTHNYYRYPARFSDRFAREAIESFTREGDVVLDPFVGGGTTLVEALAHGRRAIGTDTSRLACFVSRVKTTPLGLGNAAKIHSLMTQTVRSFDLHRSLGEQDADIHLRAVPWQLRRALMHVRSRVAGVTTPTSKMFARCILLRTAQWALDNRRRTPSTREFFDRLVAIAEQMIWANVELFEQIKANDWLRQGIGTARLIERRAAERLSDSARVKSFGRVRLILTSPPYLGVHVLYHRWQIKGRRESAAPFWFAELPDDKRTASYTFIERRAKRVDVYFSKVTAAFAAVARLVERGTPLIQLVSFAKPDLHLQSYLEAMALAGFEQCETYSRSHPSFHWREVPGRRWYNNLNGDRKGLGREVLLVHRRKK